MKKVVFTTPTKKFLAEFNQSLTAQMVIKSFPLEGSVKLWGDELYLEIGVQASDFNATMDVNVGDVCYRHENKRLCVFFGKTPASTSEKPVPAAPVVVIGRILCSPEELRGIKEGEILKITIEEDKPPVCPASENDRKLTQAEIDELVKKLLEAKKQAKT